jgi:hypothetical protein
MKKSNINAKRHMAHEVLLSLASVREESVGAWIRLRHTTINFNSDLDKPKSLLSCSSLPKESDVCARDRMTRVDHLLSNATRFSFVTFEEIHEH